MKKWTAGFVVAIVQTATVAAAVQATGTTAADALRRAMDCRYQVRGSAAAEATPRLAALDHGGVLAADVKKLRQAAGANCAMCHGK